LTVTSNLTVKILWRRTEKDERNLLKEVDEKKHGGDE